MRLRVDDRLKADGGDGEGRRWQVLQLHGQRGGDALGGVQLDFHLGPGDLEGKGRERTDKREMRTRDGSKMWQLPSIIG